MTGPNMTVFRVDLASIEQEKTSSAWVHHEIGKVVERRWGLALQTEVSFDELSLKHVAKTIEVCICGLAEKRVSFDVLGAAESSEVFPGHTEVGSEHLEEILSDEGDCVWHSESEGPAPRARIEQQAKALFSPFARSARHHHGGHVEDSLAWLHQVVALEEVAIEAMSGRVSVPSEKSDLGVERARIVAEIYLFGGPWGAKITVGIDIEALSLIHI